MTARAYTDEAIPLVVWLARRKVGVLVPEVLEYTAYGSYSSARRFVRKLVAQGWLRPAGVRRRRTDAFGRKAGRGGDVFVATRRRLPACEWERHRRQRKLRMRRIHPKP